MTEAAEPSGDAGTVGSVEVLGTAHVSHESVEEVRAAVADRRPDVVAVELDEGRYRQLQGEAPDDLEPADLLGGNTVFQFLAYWMLSYVQKRLGDRFDIQPGADMMAAVETAEEHGIDVVLVDREIQTTIRRFWTRITLPEKLKLVGGLALGATDSLTIGLAVGIAAGVLLGGLFGAVVAPAAGLGGAFALGLGETALAVVGGLVLGGFAGLFLGGGVLPAVTVPGYGRLGVLERTSAGLALGAVAGGLLAGTGTAVPLFGAPDLAPFGAAVVRGTVGAAAGTVVGVALGVGIGVVVDAVVDDPGDLDEEIDVDSMTDTDVVSAMLAEFRRFTPGGAEALIDERDAYIAHRLVALRAEGVDVLAVVGAGHRAGIEHYLANPEELPPVSSLVGEPPGRRVPWFKLLGWTLSLGFVAFFVLLALGVSDDRLLVELLAAWFLVNGAFAAGLARLAGARWQSASVGGLVAWMTSVNPLLAPGWFVGYVELLYGSVNVSDIAEMNEILDDHESPLRDVVARLLDVPLFRLVAVVAMTNVGSFVASVVFAVVVLPWFGAELVGPGCSAEWVLFGVDMSGVRCLSDRMLAGAREGAAIVWGVLA